MYCEKHGVTYRYESKNRGGKTFEVCDECEKEKSEAHEKIVSKMI